MKRILNEINNVLSNHNIKEQLSLEDIVVTEAMIHCSPTVPSKLANLIINYYWPSLTEKEVFHFTSKDACESICKTGKFRLTNIEKRYTDGEIKTFCEQYNLDGYLRNDPKIGYPNYKSLLMPNLFYGSFTDIQITETEENYFWETFASPQGVRIKFKIKAKRDDFREIYYGTEKISNNDLLKELIDCAAKYNKKFIFVGISKMCAFYLGKNEYGKEKEYRLLVKTFNNFPPIQNLNGEYSYIEIPLNKENETGYFMEILEICTDEQLNIPKGIKCIQRN